MPGKQEYTGWWFGTWIWLSISYMGCHPSHWRTHSYFSRWLIIAPPTSISLWLMILYLILPDTGRSEKNIMGNISRHWDDASLFGVGMEWPQGREQCTNSWLFTIRCYNKTMAPWLVNENWWFSYSQDSEDIPRLIYNGFFHGFHEKLPGIPQRVSAFGSTRGWGNESHRVGPKGFHSNWAIGPGGSFDPGS